MNASYADRVFLTLVKNRDLNRLALQALRKATHLLGLAMGTRLAELRDSPEPLQTCFSHAEENALLANLFREAASILAARWDKLPQRRRPQYTPEQRFRILRFKDLLALSVDETAQWFRVCPDTVARWQRATLPHPEPQTVGPRIRPKPPLRRYADVVRHLVQTMAVLGFGGNQKIAQTLARAGWKLSKETVRRIRKEPPPPSPPTESSPERSVQARYPSHVWMADLTDVPGLFGIFSFKVAAVLDVFSRMPLAAQVFHAEPPSRAIAQLFKNAARIYGSPRHFVSDQGTQFTANPFQNALRRAGVRHRFGAVGKTGSIAIIERVWRTLKNTSSLRSFKPLVRGDLQRRLQLGLIYYAYLRPHQGLGGATPAEVFFGCPPAHLAAVPPPRARPREGPIDSPFEIAFLDSEKKLPFLICKAA